MGALSFDFFSLDLRSRMHEMFFVRRVLRWWFGLAKVSCAQSSMHLQQFTFHQKRQRIRSSLRHYELDGQPSPGSSRFAVVGIHPRTLAKSILRWAQGEPLET